MTEQRQDRLDVQMVRELFSAAERASRVTVRLSPGGRERVFSWLNEVAAPGLLGKQQGWEEGWIGEIEKRALEAAMADKAGEPVRITLSCFSSKSERNERLEIPAYDLEWSLREGASTPQRDSDSSGDDGAA